VSINISGKTLLNTDLITLFSPFLPYINNYKIVIEVTETSLIEHFDYVSNVLQQLRKLGFLIALDDFGSGYSSIRYLANMPVDIIKFDMSLLRALENGDTKTQAILYATANMIVAAGYQLVVEGVETEAQVQLTKQLGASHIQGYYFGKPSPNFIIPKTIIN
jgi:EAL domain-containing protein (putative c-di-GMP-specific phosphodiesterase class I)